MFTLVSVIGTITLCTIIVWLLSSPFYWRNKGVPYLIPLPLFGNCLPLINNSLHKFYDHLYKRFPNAKYFGIHFLTKPVLIIKDMSLIKDILVKDFGYFEKNGFYSNIDSDLFGVNLLYLYGESWKVMRNKLSHSFTPIKLRSINRYVENSMTKLNNCIELSINKKEPIEIYKYFIKLSTDIIVQTTFGVDNDFYEKNIKFPEIWEQLLGIRPTVKFIMGQVFPEIVDLFKIKTHDTDFTNFIGSVLKEAIEYRKRNNIELQDFLQNLISMLQSGTNENGCPKYYPDGTRLLDYNFNTILAQALIVLTGGTDTSATTMTFLMYEIAKNQEIQDKCRQEIIEVYKKTGQDVRCEDVHHLKYLDMVIKETMRKYPPFSILTRKCTKPYCIKKDNVIIEPETLIIIPIKSIQLDPIHYPDPERFDPERFSLENKGNVNASSYLVFGLGPRICIGKQFVKLELFTAISRLLRRYKFSLSPKTEILIKMNKYTIVQKPTSGIWLNVVPIN